MATETKDKPQTVQTADVNPPGIGAYSGVANPQKDLRLALDKSPQSKIDGSLDFTDSDKRWLKALGITTTDPNSHHEEWRTDQEQYRHMHRKWNEGLGGRLALRTLSRGVVGAAFYAVANIHASNALKTYTNEVKPEELEGVLQHIAYFIDHTAGKAIQMTARIFSDDPEKIQKTVMFRDTRNFKFKNEATGAKIMGRSLGAEAVGITFDFASMSFGDYMTRYFLGLMDPNARSHWMKDGHIDVPGGLKDLLKNTFRGVTYAAGEDMAVAIPYVYGMRMQRNIINHFSPGFAEEADLALNGASYKHRNGKIVGDYQLEGMMDLAGRFSWYNVGTKMFRDAYSRTAAAVERWWDSDDKFKMPHIDKEKFTPENIGLSAAHAVRYAVRTTIKVLGYMAAATPFFFLTRSPQTKFRGVVIDAPEYGSGNKSKGVLSRDIMRDGKLHRKALTGGAYHEYGGIAAAEADLPKMYWSHDKEGTIGTITHYPLTTNREDVFTNRIYERNGTQPPLHNDFTNFVGKLNYDPGTGLNKVLSRGNEVLQKKFGVHVDSFTPRNIEGFSRRYVNAAVSYTPYFMMKTDMLSAEWDTARTDMGLDRSLDGIGSALAGIVTLNGKKIKSGLSEFQAGVGETRRSMMREPFLDPKREEMAQRERWYADPEHGSNEAYQLSGIDKRAGLKRDDDGNAAGKNFAHEGLKPKPVTPATLTQLKTPASWVSQEAVRKFQDASPDGQSVH